MEGARASGPPPLSVGGVINSSFELYRKQAVTLWSLTAIVVVPAQVLIWIIVRVTLSGNAFARDGTVYTSGSTAWATVSVGVIGFLSAILVMGALSRLLAETYTGHSSTWQESLRYASSHFAPLLWLGIVAVIALGIGYLLLLLPGVFLTVAWSVAVPVLMFEASSVFGALSRSWELVRGNWWRVFGALIVGLVIVFGISYLVGAILGTIASSSSLAVVLTLSSLSRAIAGVLAYPLVAAISVVIYTNLRSLNEGVAPEALVPAAE